MYSKPHSLLQLQFSLPQDALQSPRRNVETGFARDGYKPSLRRMPEMAMTSGRLHRRTTSRTFTSLAKSRRVPRTPTNVDCHSLVCRRRISAFPRGAFRRRRRRVHRRKPSKAVPTGLRRRPSSPPGPGPPRCASPRAATGRRRETGFLRARATGSSRTAARPRRRTPRSKGSRTGSSARRPRGAGRGTRGPRGSGRPGSSAGRAAARSSATAGRG
jgi:hypothetical protein